MLLPKSVLCCYFLWWDNVFPFPGVLFGVIWHEVIYWFGILPTEGCLQGTGLELVPRLQGSLMVSGVPATWRGHFLVFQVPFTFPPWIVCFGREPRRKKTNSSWVGLTPSQVHSNSQTGREGFPPEAQDGPLSSPAPRILTLSAAFVFGLLKWVEKSLEALLRSL